MDLGRRTLARRAGVSTVIGTMIFIVAAVSIFAAVAATNIAGFNYQNAVQQADAKNALKSQESLQTSPAYDTSAYAEFGLSSGNWSVSFPMTPSSPVLDWAEAALAMYNSSSGISVTQHYSFACPGSDTCTLPLIYPPTEGDTIVVGVAVNSDGGYASPTVRDTLGTSYGQRGGVSGTRSGESYLASAIFTGKVGPVAGGDTVTVSSGVSSPATFTIFVYDVSGGKTFIFAPEHGTGHLTPFMKTDASVDVQRSNFIMAVVIGPGNWQAIAGAGFSLEASPAEPGVVTVADSGPTNVQFTNVIYVYNKEGGTSTGLGQYVEPFNEGASTCGTSGTVAPGGSCTYGIHGGAVSGLSQSLSLTDPEQRLSVGFTTSLGNTFWFNYTEFVALALAAGAPVGYPYLPNMGDLINIVVAQGLGPNKLVFQGFNYVYSSGAGAAGSGLLVGGYSGYTVPEGTSLMWAVTVTNYDPQERTITIGPESQVMLTSLQNQNLGNFKIVGQPSDGTNDQGVVPGTFDPIPIPYKGSATLYFGPDSTSHAAKNNIFTLSMLLVGSYEGGIPFSQIIPVAGTIVTDATYGGCYVGAGTGGVACDTAFQGADPALQAGGTYTFRFNGMSSVPSTFLMTTPGGSNSPKSIEITGSHQTLTSESFTIPAGTTPGFYEVYVSDGTNIVPVTVRVT